MRKLIASALLLASVAFATTQEMPPPPPELAKMDALMGAWHGTGTSMFPGMEGTVSSYSKVTKAFNFWYQSDFTDKMAGMETSGRVMVTYDPMAKKWIGVWFNGDGPEAVKMWGTFNGNVLDMTSESFDMMGSKVQARVVHRLLNKTTLDIEISMKMNGEWMQVQHVTYKKK